MLSPIFIGVSASYRNMMKSDKCYIDNCLLILVLIS